MGEGIDSVTAYTNFRLSANVEILNIQGALVTGIAADTGSMISSFGSRNVMVSGKGSDVLIDRTTDKQNMFQFDVASGKDSVYGFTATGANHDLIRVNHPQFTSFDTLKSAMTQVGADVRIDFTATDAVLLRNVSLTNLGAEDFLLPFSPDKLKLTFSDEFDALSLYSAASKTGTWKTTYTYGPSDGVNSINSRTLPGNGEKEIYVDPTYAGDPSKSTSPLGLNPFAINSGVLSITAEKLSDDLSNKLYGYDYSSGLLTTEKTFAQTYGYFEMKAELPIEKGMFPAFWMLPTSRTWPPEIDIMENVGENWVSGGSIAPDDRDAFRTFFPDGLSGMHSYGLLWTRETITWYVDGKAVGSVPTPDSMHQPMYLIVNLAVGGDWAGDPAASFDSATMKVDYVRAYSLEQAGSTPAAAPAPAPDATPLSAAVSTTLAAGQQGLILTGTAAIDGTGNELNNSITGNSAANRLSGLAGNDTLNGAAGNDTLSGGAGNDVLQGGAGADSLAGGTGDDSYFVDATTDMISEAAGGGYDHVSSAVSFTLAAEIEALTITGTGNVFAKGNDIANVLTGNGGHNALVGNGGADRLIGNDGNDNLSGGNGNDMLQGGNGADRLEGGQNNDILTGGAGIDSFVFNWSFGTDHVTDFGAGGEKDVIDLSTWLAKNIAPVLSQTAVGAQIAFTGGYTIILDGVDAADLARTSIGYVYDGL